MHRLQGRLDPSDVIQEAYLAAFLHLERLRLEWPETRRDLRVLLRSYGLEPNRHVLDTFLRYHHEQGLSKKRFAPEELFARETLESFKV